MIHDKYNHKVYIIVDYKIIFASLVNGQTFKLFTNV